MCSKIVLVYNSVNYIFFFGFFVRKSISSFTCIFFLFLFSFFIFFFFRLIFLILFLRNVNRPSRLWREGETLKRSSGCRGILNVSARPRINLPGRSDRVVKHSHHVSFALITKSFTQFLMHSFILSFILFLAYSFVFSPDIFFLFDLN